MKGYVFVHTAAGKSLRVLEELRRLESSRPRCVGACQISLPLWKRVIRKRFRLRARQDSGDRGCDHDRYTPGLRAVAVSPRDRGSERMNRATRHGSNHDGGSYDEPWTEDLADDRIRGLGPRACDARPHGDWTQLEGLFPRARHLRRARGVDTGA